MVNSVLPVQASLAVTVSDLKTLRQLADSGQLKTWQAGALLDVVVNRREGGLLMLDTGKGLIGLPVPTDSPLKPGTALQLQVLSLAPLQIQLRPTPEQTAGNKSLPGLLPAVLSSNSTSVVAGGLPPAPITAAASLPPASQLPGQNADPVDELARQLVAVLRPLLNQSAPERLQALPARLSEWLARAAHGLNEQDPATIPGRANAIDWPKLTSALLASWPNSEQASEPEQLETLLRRTLFGEPGSPSSANPNPTGTAPRNSGDWLGTLFRLLQALPSAAPQTGTQTATVTTTTQTTIDQQGAPAKTARRDEPASTTASLPLPDEWIDELATLVGRQQQHWLSNLQTDNRQQPLYAELLLRHGERLDPFELNIREEDSQHNSGEKSPPSHHVVRLRFDLPGLGVCQFLLDLNNDDLQLHFYSEQADTVSLFNQYLDTLAGTLAADAIHLTSVQSHRVDQLPALQTPTEQGFHVRA